MRRLLPSPGLSLALFVLWLLLTQSFGPGTLLLGAAMAVFWPLATTRLRPAPGRMRRPLVLLRLCGRVFADMLRSNLAVAVAILIRPAASLRSRFVNLPLELRDPNGLAALAMIVTFTPGTAWVRLSADRSTLLLHVLDVEDEAALISELKERYERALIEVFQ